MASILALFANPLEVFAGAAEKLLGGASASPITPSDAAVLAGSSNVILAKCNEAAAAKNVRACGWCLKVLHDTFLVAADALVNHASQDEDALTQVSSVFSALVVENSCGEDRRESFLTIIQCYCSASPIKEKLGPLWIPAIIKLLQFDETVGFRSRRLLVTSLINLIKSSRNNKLQFTNSDFIGNEIARSGDFFMQLQCVELLFRLSRLERALLEKCSTLPKSLIEDIQGLPNDRTLLDAMIRVIQHYNEEQDPAKVLCFDLVSVEFAGKMICSASTVHFSSRLLVILLPDGHGENITIPYQEIRSVRASKDHKMGLRLHSSCDLVGFSKDAPNGDMLIVQFSLASLNRLKSSPVHGWIAAEVSRCRSLQQSTVKKPEESAPNTKKRSRSNGEKTTKPEAVADNPSPQHTAPPPAQPPQPQQQPAPVTPPASKSRSRGHIVERDSNSTSSSRKKRARKEDGDVAPQSGLATTTTTTIPVKRGRSPGADEVSMVLDSTEDSVDDVMQRIQTIVQGKVSKQREQHISAINDALMEVQALVNRAREENRAERDAYQSSVQNALAEITSAKKSINEKITNAVSQLNAGLQEIQSIGGVIRNQIESIRQELDGQLQSARRKEEEDLRVMKGKVEEEMKQMDATLSSYISAVHPLRFLTSYLSRKMMEEAAAS